MLLSLISKKNEPGNVVTFRFKADKPLVWQAGQYMQYTLSHESPDDEGVNRWFTIASAPYEGEVQITTRITESTFKQTLNNLEIGSNIEADGQPDGDFTWVDHEKPLLWVAGGIGVTPYHSILKERAHNNQKLPVKLLYANRNDEIVFKQEFEKLAQDHPELEIYYEIGKPLDLDLIKSVFGDLTDSVVYLSGPEPMVDTLGDQLKENGVGVSNLKQDWFPGYTSANF
jgi:ferredoxin-NADP reductase